MRMYLCILMAVSFSACTTLKGVKSIEDDLYLMRSSEVEALTNVQIPQPAKLKVNLLVRDSGFFFSSPLNIFPDKTLAFSDVNSFTFFKHTFDFDILTIPFKVRPSVKGFPTQLNPNFSAALYVGKRIDRYTVQRLHQYNKPMLNVKGAGFGFGIFMGPGAVTMNPFVTRNAIHFEYDGFVLSTGIACIYDAKIFNLGLAAGLDYLVDKNREYWIYQNKPWIGVLFGLNLN